MKKTIKINISGFVFHIDEDAYDRLSAYLDKLSMRYRGTDGEQEILADIEARIAEIFQTRTSADKESLNLADVDEVVGILGEPEEFADVEEGEAEKSESSQRSYSGQGGRRRLYRDPNNKVIGGVCGGIGEYFGIDPVIMRVLFVVFFLLWGTGLLIYILLWIAIPEARTTAEKLEMSGKDINVDNIEKSIRKEYDSVKDNLKNIPNSAAYKRTRSGVNTVGRGIGQVIITFLKVIGIIIGGSLVLAGVVALVAIIGTLIAGQTWLMGDLWEWQQYGLPEMLSLFVDESVAILGIICIILVIALPVLGLIYGGIKLMFPFRANDRAIGFSGFGIWIVAVVLLAIFAASEAIKYNDYDRITQTESIDMPEKNLYLMVAESEYNYPNKLELDFGYRHELSIAEQGKDLIILGMPTLDIVQHDDEEAEISIRKEARGVNANVAQKYAEAIQYNYTIQDSLLIIDPWFRLGDEEKWRDQQVEFIIRIPVGYRVFLDESTRDYLYRVDNQDNVWSKRMVGQSWIMEEDGLTRADKETD